MKEEVTNHELRVKCDKLRISKKGGKNAMLERIKIAEAAKKKEKKKAE